MMWLSNFGMLFIIAISVLYWLMPQAWRPWLLTAGGCLLLAHDSWISVLVWSGLIVWLALICGPSWRRHALVQKIGLTGLLIAFATYQYGKAWQGLLPYLGFAFVTLKAWHLIAEHGPGAYRQGRMASTLSYLLFPPTLPVGPVQRYDAFRMEALRARWDSQAASRALERILYGYCKIVLLANYLLAHKLQNLSGLTDHAWLATYLGLLAYGLDLYWQFSGYCDIAIGFALLLGMRMPENFNFPFAARNLPDFWRRWHITVSEWCRDFVFRPLFARSHNYLAASLGGMMVLGLWHELSPRYLAWGLFHGAGLGVVHLWSKYSPWAEKLRNYKTWRLAGWFLTLQFVILSFALTSSPTIAEAMTKLAILSGLHF